MPRKYTYTGNDRTLKQLIIDQKPAISHYIPRGERSKWSKAQYTVYKEEKRATRKERWAVRKPTLDTIAEKINHRWKYRSITDGSRNRTVLGEVPGRRNGEPAVEKNEYGIPVVDKAEIEEDGSDSGDESGSEEEEGEEEGKAGPSKAKSTTIVPTQLPSNGKPPINKAGSRKRVHASESEESEEEVPVSPKRGRRSNNSTIKSNPERKSKKPASKGWVVPDSSDESTNELDYMKKQGLKVVHDHWPSPWRVMAAALVNTDRINKSVSPVSFRSLT
jgi:hypothetical protein